MSPSDVEHMLSAPLSLCRAAGSTGTSSSPQHRTVAIAVSAAAIDNAQSPELATAMAGQIARTAAVFNVDEIVVIDELSGPE